MVFKVYVVAGHGGKNSTPGKRTPDGEYEWNFNDKVVDAFIDELSKYDGVEIKRGDDASGNTDIPLSTRTNEANAWGADIYVSEHHNANTGTWGTWTGTETYYYEGSKKGRELAELLHNAALKAYGLRNRGIKRGNHLWEMRKPIMPSVLVEGGFMDSRVDIQKMRDDDILEKSGRLQARAVAEYAGLKKEKTKKEDNHSSSGSYTVKKGDTLWSIANEHGMSVKQLKSLNGLKSNTIHPGDKLKLGKSSSKTKYVEVLAPSLWVYNEANWNAKHRTVKKGEVFTIKKTITVSGSTMHQLKSGLYITNNPKYVRVYEK